MADGELTDEAHTSVNWRWSNEQDQQVSIQVNTHLESDSKMGIITQCASWNHHRELGIMW